MRERSPAFIRLCEAALVHFAKAGYDGASLSTIAQALGIRKASLYSHVKSKDELYLLLLGDALRAEGAFAAECFAKASGESRLPGEAYVQALAARYQGSLHMQLLLKAAYFPPAAHKALIVEEFTGFYEALRQLFLADFDKMMRDEQSLAARDLYGESWLGIVDSLCVELLYGSAARTTLRKDAMLMLLSQALRP